MQWSVTLLLSSLALTACGSFTILRADDESAGGSGGEPSTSSASSSTSTSSSSSGTGGTMAGVPHDGPWATELSGDIEVLRVAATPNDAPVVLARVEGWKDSAGVADFGGADVVCNECLVVAQYDGAGKLSWSQVFDSPYVIDDEGLDVDEQGSIYLAARFTNYVIVADTQIGEGALGASNFFVLKLTSSGDVAWTTTATSAYTVGKFGQSLEDLDVSPAGEHAIVGAVADGTSVGGPPLSGPAGLPFVARYDAGGNHLFSTELPDGLRVQAVGLVDGVLHVAGHSMGDLVVDGATLPLGAPVLLRVLDSSGVETVFFDDSADADIVSVRATGAGGVGLAGVLRSAMTIGGETLTASGPQAPLVFAAAVGGASPFARTYGEPEDVDGVRWGPDGRMIFFRSASGLWRTLARVDAPGGASDWQDGDAPHSVAAAAGTGDWILTAGVAKSPAVLPGGLSVAAGPFVAKLDVPSE